MPKWILINKESSAEFLLLVLIKFWSVDFLLNQCFFAYNVLICLKQELPLQATAFFFATLVIKTLTEDLLIIFETFTWLWECCDVAN